MKSNKQWLTCLRCGRRIYTDIYNRLCRRCKEHNANLGVIAERALNCSLDMDMPSQEIRTMAGTTKGTLGN